MSNQIILDKSGHVATKTLKPVSKTHLTLPTKREE